jgi:2-polyprenyl-6-methoxyphenol hydroxylase-like FAD-dependent oxidoreductase
MPALLFLRERDLHTALLEAAHWEQHRGTVHVHCDSDKMRVVGLEENSSQPWSARLVLERDQMTSRDYHLIVAADGTHSLLRQRYGGHQDPNDARILTGTAKMGSFLGTTAGASPASLSPSSLSSPNDLPQMSSAWNQLQQEEAVGLQDRNYTVFRGNSPLSASEVGMSVPGSSRGEGGPVSFQTWGEGRNMRFATVPMSYPVGIHRQNQQQHREERQVWFITIDDDRIAAEADPLRRRTLLLEAFQNWHDPIRRIVEATPPESILMERAVAHRHSMAPVLNLNRVLEKTRGRRPPNSGEGPCLAFIGDANMTVDPILAQGFTVAVEGAHELARAVQSACVVPCPHDPTVAFHPQVLRRELQARYESSVERIICLLRATELVQALGQPAGGTISGFLHTMILRPLVWMLPNAIKAPIFDATLKYSLGVLGKNRMKGHQAS